MEIELNFKTAAKVGGTNTIENNSNTIFGR